MIVDDEVRFKNNAVYFKMQQANNCVSPIFGYQNTLLVLNGL